MVLETILGGATVYFELALIGLTVLEVTQDTVSNWVETWDSSATEETMGAIMQSPAAPVRDMVALQWQAADTLSKIEDFQMRTDTDKRQIGFYEAGRLIKDAKDLVPKGAGSGGIK